MRTIPLFLISILLVVPLWAQNSNVPVGHPVYHFLLDANAKGLVSGFDEAVLPATQKTIITALNELLVNPSASGRDKQLAADFMQILVFEQIPPDSSISVFSLPLHQWHKSHFYVYRNYPVTFTGEPVLQMDFLHASPVSAPAASAFMVSYGAKFTAEYDSAVSVYIYAVNGSQYGNREVAKLDSRVAQSLAFNKTKLNNFDNASAVISWQNKHILVQGGKDRVLWGSSPVDKLILSENPQQFDFVRVGIVYGVVNYSYLHGWLAQSPLLHQLDSSRSITQYIQKYIALSRLNIRLGNLSAGFTQSVIYGGRGVELAYLNPFLFWESAQRSMNDLDNSFLGVDLRYTPVAGIQMQAEWLLDDLNFATLFKDGWRASGNRSAWQAAIRLLGNGLPEGLSLFAGITEVRPHCFSHPGITDDALAFTNNGWQLGTPVPPNAREWHARLSFQPSAALLLNSGFRWMKHGKNVTDAGGKILRNTGGDVLKSYSYFTPSLLPMFDGDVEHTQTWYADCSWRYSSLIEFSARYSSIAASGSANVQFSNWFAFSMRYAFY